MEDPGARIRGQHAEAMAWLTSREALALARRQLASHQLSVELAEDMCQEAARSVTRTFAARAEPYSPDPGPVAVAVTALKRRVLDVLGTVDRRALDLGVRATGIGLAPEATHDVDLAGDSDVADEVVAALEGITFEADCRRAVHGLLAPRPWAGSAALTKITLICHPATVLAADVPQPSAASRPGEEDRRNWTALFYAGCDDCLPGATGTDAAVRQRRSQRTRTVDALLRAAATTARVGRDDEVPGGPVPANLSGGAHG